MARLERKQAEELVKSSGGVNYFKIQEDKQIRKVRFLYRTEADIEYVSVHKGDNYQAIDCGIIPEDKTSSCPLCESGISRAMVRVYVPILDLEDNQVYVWERSMVFVDNTIKPLIARYPDFYKHTFEIERNGVKGYKDTSYGIFYMDTDSNLSFEDLPKEVDVYEAGIVKKKSVEDMQYFVETGEFPKETTSESTRTAPRSTPQRGRSESTREALPRHRRY